MVKISSLDVSAAEFPVDKTFTFDGTQYLLRFRKNKFTGYSVEIYTDDGATFLYANKIVYGENLIDCPVVAPFSDKIIPLCVSLLTSDTGTTDIDDSTLGDKILLITDIEAG